MLASCQTLPPLAMGWFAEPQAEERRECEPGSASKPSVTAASGSCRLKSAATWARKRKAEEHQPRSGPVQTHPNSRLHLQSASWRTRRLSLVAARRAVGNILPRKERRDGRVHHLPKLNVLCAWPRAPLPMASSPLRFGKEGSWPPPSDHPVNLSLIHI